MMLSKTYVALVAAGAPEDKAREASEEIAGFQKQLSGIESDVKGLQETKWLVRILIAYLVVWSLKTFLT